MNDLITFKNIINEENHVHQIDYCEFKINNAFSFGNVYITRRHVYSCAVTYRKSFRNILVFSINNVNYGGDSFGCILMERFFLIIDQ